MKLSLYTFVCDKQAEKINREKCLRKIFISPHITQIHAHVEENLFIFFFSFMDFPYALLLFLYFPNQISDLSIFVCIYTYCAIAFSFLFFLHLYATAIV